MSAVDIVITVIALVFAGIAYWALLERQRRSDDLHAEFLAHEDTREQFRATALEADRNAEALADVTEELHRAWESAGAAVIARSLAEQAHRDAIKNLTLVLREVSS